MNRNDQRPLLQQPKFLSPRDVASLVRKRGVRRVLREIAEAIAEDFLRWNDFDKAPRVANHSADGVIELMPVSDSARYAFKYVNGHPKNTRDQLPTVMAFGVFSDVATGLPLMLSEMTLTTALRTAAMSALAAKLLARTNSRSMALIGNGAQSEFQAIAFHELLGVDRFHLFDIDADATDKLMANLSRALPTCAVHRFASAKDAVRGCDIVTTVTADKTNATILTADMIENGMHINGVGGDCPGKTEVHADVLRAARVFVEFEPQTRIEGDLQQMPSDFSVTEFWNVLAGNARGRCNSDEITFFDSVGFAIEDFSALRYLYQFARDESYAKSIELIPGSANVKDLYALLESSDAEVTIAA